MFRLGLAGGGRMGLMHLCAVANSSAVAFAAVAEPNPKTADRLRRMGLRVHASVTGLLESGDIDGVVIAAPTDQHRVLVEQVVSAGMPVLCEKPCGFDASETSALGSLALRHDVPIQVGYWRRFVPQLQEMRQHVVEGGVGNVHLIVCSQWDESPPDAAFRMHSGGIFVDMGVHEIDQARWLTGQEVVASATTTYPTTEDAEAAGDADSGHAMLTMSGGTTVMITVGRFHPGGDFVAAELYGSRAHQRAEVVSPALGNTAQIDALCLQAEAFARYAAGGDSEGASISDAEEALAIARRLSADAGVGRREGGEA